MAEYIREKRRGMNHQLLELKKVRALFCFLIVSLSICFLFKYCQASAETLKIAIIPHRSNLGNEQAYNMLFRELTSRTGISFQWLGSKTYDDVINKIHTGEADIGYVGPFSYVSAQDSFGVRIICRTVSKGNSEFYHSMIMTRKDSGIESLQELKGKSFSFTDPKSTSGYLFPMAELKAAGISQEDFQEVKFLKRHANSLLAVYNGHVDAGATSVTAVDKVDVNMEEINILWRSEPIYRGLWIARKDLPDEQFNSLQKAMLEVSDSEHSKAIFENLTTKGFKRGKDRDYDNVRKVIKWMKTN